MASLDKKILTITKPTIPIDEMNFGDTSTANAPLQSTTKRFNEAGSIWPLIQINNHQFDEKEVINFYLDENSFIPRIRVGITITDGVFISKYFPKDGDPMSIFIRSHTDTFKPIRADFEITLVNAFPSKSESGEVQEFIIEGVLRIPGLYGEWCKTFKNQTSYNAIISACNELLIGFASNEVSTDDQQTWINPFDTYEKFLNEIMNASYKDDDSFFKGWIDHYYYFNFVNMNNQFSDEAGLDDALESFTFSDDYIKGSKIQLIDTQILLTNHISQRATGNFIHGYTLVNKAGQIFMNNGYRRFLQYYDSELHNTIPSNNYQSYFVEPLTTKGTDNKILLKGRTKENFYGKAADRSDSKFNRYKWMGIQSELPNGNCHKNYFQAIIQNKQNNEEIEKMMLRIDLPKCNFNLYKGQRVPVIILNYGNTSRQKQTATDKQGVGDNMSVDKFLTGYYTIYGTTYSWDSHDGIFVQQLLLTRREWPIPNYSAVVK